MPSCKRYCMNMPSRSRPIALLLAFAALSARAPALPGSITAPSGAVTFPSSPLSTNDKIAVVAEATENAGVSDLEAVCQIDGATFYIDRNYVGPIPYAGKLSPGSHYLELDLPGYEPLGIWLTLDEKTKYTVTFNPDQNVPLFATNNRVTVTSVPTLNAGISNYQIFCAIGGGELYVDQIDVGPVPMANIPFAGSVAPGSHYFELELPGYRNLGFWLSLNDKTQYTITLAPERITGYISINVEPADALASIDGSSAIKGTVEAAIGSHRIVIKRFGYIEQQINVQVTEKATYYVDLSLEKAPFAVTGLGFDRPRFNPRNVGAQGRTNLRFEASNYGSARAEIRGPDGALVAILDFPNIDTWVQSRSWNGLGQDGSPLPDGVYTVTLTASPVAGLPAQAGGSAAIRTQVRIDSSLVIRSIGIQSAVPGLLYMPDPLIQPAGTLAAEVSWFAPWGEAQSSAFGISAALSLAGRATLALNASEETVSGASAGSDLAGSTLVSLLGGRTSLVSGSFFLRGAYSSISTPSLPGGGKKVEASLPVSLRLGEFSAALSPGALVDFSASSPSLQALGRAGIWIEGGSFRVGASGELPLSLAESPPAAIWPAEAALEGRLMLGSTPLVASAYVDASFQPGTGPDFGIGIGLGFLF